MSLNRRASVIKRDERRKLTAKARDSAEQEFVIRKSSNSATSVVMRKNPKITKNCKFCLNEIKYLQLLIFAKRDFFS
jgi:hypothetical protein